MKLPCCTTKKTNELMAQTYHHLFGVHSTGLRFFTVYGPWGRPDMAIFLFTKAILEGKTINVFNYGKMKRDFTYIDDIIVSTCEAIDKNYNCEVFNLGNHKSEKLMDVVHLIENNLGKKGYPVFVEETRMPGSNKALHRVFVGKFVDKRVAEKTAISLKEIEKIDPVKQW